MEPITYILGVAGSVVASVLTDLITGRTKRARQEEIERHVALAISRERQDNAVIREELARAMAEVSLLVARHPHLSTKGTDVVLSGTKVPKVIFTAARRNALLIDELRSLDEILAARREELTETGDEQPGRMLISEAQNDPSPTSDEIERARKGRWSLEIGKMGDEIRRRRGGE